jgi:hypothetical protein
MNWLVLLSHAFNPLLVSIDISESDETQSNGKSTPISHSIAILITSFIIYLLWLGAHFAAIELFGSGFDFDEFIGDGQGYAYFLPFVLGAVILVLNFFVIPYLKTERQGLLARYLRGMCQFLGGYFMLINYLAWIAG